MVDSQPRVSILIPVLDEQETIGTVLDAASAQTYPADLIEVFVVDGGSTDRTREVVAERAERDSNVSLLDNPRRHQSSALNLASSRATGEVLIRWDAHAEYPDDYVASIVAALEETGATMVGAAWIPVGASPVGRAVAAAMSSPFSVGHTRFAPTGVRRIVDTVACGAMTRADLVAVSGFDETMRPAGEDADLAYRITARGGTVVLDPSIEVRYLTRGTVKGVARQYFGYGMAKAAMLFKHRRLPTFRPLAPALLLGIGVLASIASPRVGAALIAVYALVLGIGILSTVKAPMATRVVAVFASMVMHVAYGAGWWFEVVARVMRIRGRREHDDVAATLPD